MKAYSENLAVQMQAAGQIYDAQWSSTPSDWAFFSRKSYYLNIVVLFKISVFPNIVDF